MKHCIVIQDKAGAHYQVYASNKGAAEMVAGLAFAGGAARCWIDGTLVSGPIDELLADYAA